jgi:hypothetical protein
VPSGWICRPIRRPPPGADQPGEGDRIGACRHRPIAVVSARPAGGCRPSHHTKGGGHHHHDPAGAGADHRRGRPPRRGPRRGRQRRLRAAPGHHQRGDHPGRRCRAAGLGPPPGPGRGLGDRRDRQLRGWVDALLHRHGQVVVEVNRPDRAARRRRGTADPVDAGAAARAVQARGGAVPKAGDGQVAMVRPLGWPGPPRPRPAPGRQRPQRRWWSPHPMGCAGSWVRGQRCGWPRPPPAWRRVRSPPRRPRPGWGWGPWPAATRFFSRPSWRCWRPGGTG